MIALTRPVRGGRAAWLALPVLILSWLLAAGLALAQPSEPRFPQLTGRVVDQAQLLSPEVEQQLTQKLEALERDTSDQLVVVSVSTLQDYPIEDYGYRLGRAWGIGQKDQDNGALLIVAPNERKVRIESGYGLEPILTDALSALIIQNQILPAFRVGGYERGITQGVDAIDAQLRLDPEEARARAAAAGARPKKADAPVASGAFIAIIFFILFIMLAGAGGRGRRRRGMGPVLVWAASEALRNSGRGGWGGGGGFGGGGGGFGGGGGSFGGGGASGGW